MKNLKDFLINESNGDNITVEEIATVICDLASENESNIKMMTADEIMGYADEVEIGHQLQEDEDEISDFIQDNYEAIMQAIDKFKKEY